MLNYSTFQTTHNNAMNTKPSITIYVSTPKLSEEIQYLAFRHGKEWSHAAKNICNTEKPLLIINQRAICYSVNDDEVYDYDAANEFGKIVQWFEDVEKESEIAKLKAEIAILQKWKAEYCELESKWDIQKVGQELGLSPGTLINPEILPGIQRLKREIAQLRDELDAKSSESFPEGYDWHNPHGLTNEQIGVSEGWRLLLKEEINQDREPSLDLEAWSIVRSKWCEGLYYGDIENQTYRTKWPLPSLKNTPTSHPDTKTVSESKDDDFPTPERQEKEAGLKWFLEYLKRCKEVSFFTNEGIDSYTFKYGKSSMGYYFGEKDGKIGVMAGGRNGEFINITITQINP